IVNSVGDYGLAALKSATRKVAVGAGEAGMRMAAALGNPFAIVTIWPSSTGFLYQKVLRECGLTGSCRQVLHVGTEDEQAALGQDQDYIARMQGGDSTLLGRIIGRCREAVDDGAAAILLGCTCMSPIAAKVQA